MRPSVLLKLSGYSSLEKLRDDFGAYMVDVGYIAEEHDGYVLVAPDDLEHVQLHREEDYEWFERVVVTSLRQAGEQDILAVRHTI
jgi:hypothetical protein